MRDLTPMIEFANIPGTPNYRLRCEVRLPASIDQVFEFFSDATQLERLTPGWLRFSVLTPTPITMCEGTLIDYKLRVHGIPLRWRSRISLWDPPYRFADEQLRGPYRRWYHIHSFEEDRGGDNLPGRSRVFHYWRSTVHTLFVRA